MSSLKTNFLLLIDIPIQDRARKITIHQVFTLDIPHGNYSAHYDISTQYFGVTKDATMGLELSHTQFEVCKQANGQFCHISMPFQPLASPTNMHYHSICQKYSQHRIQMFSPATQSFNHPSPYTDHARCLDTHNPYLAPMDTISLICPEKPMETIPIRQPLHVLKLPTACSATSANFYLPLRYETPILNVNVSLDMANLRAINITALHFHIWQHMGCNHSETELQHLATLPSIPVHKVYHLLLNNSLQLRPFNMQPSEDTNTLWKLFIYPGIYVSV